MRKFIYPNKDATIYEQYPTLNSGLDEILDVGKTATGSTAARSLISFDTTSISQSMANGSIPASASFYLNLYVANATGLKANQAIQLYPVSQSWTEGSGYSIQLIENPSDGVSWSYRTDIDESLPWTGSTFITTIGATSYEKEFTFSWPAQDVRLDITNIVRAWNSGSFANNGLVIKITDGEEDDFDVTAKLSFFSNQTHTIYRPTLEAWWDSSTYTTGSLALSNIVDSYITVRNLAPTYHSGSVAKVNLTVRERYPRKTFANVFSQYSGSQCLPVNSYFAIVDESTGRIVYPFDAASKISCNASGSFFFLDTSGLYPHREYKVLIKAEDASANPIIIDTKSSFKIR